MLNFHAYSSDIHLLLAQCRLKIVNRKNVVHLQILLLRANAQWPDSYSAFFLVFHESLYLRDTTLTCLNPSKHSTQDTVIFSWLP